MSGRTCIQIDALVSSISVITTWRFHKRWSYSQTFFLMGRFWRFSFSFDSVFPSGWRSTIILSFHLIPTSFKQQILYRLYCSHTSYLITCYFYILAFPGGHAFPHRPKGLTCGLYIFLTLMCEFLGKYIHSSLFEIWPMVWCTYYCNFECTLSVYIHWESLYLIYRYTFQPSSIKILIQPWDHGYVLSAFIL